MWLLTASVGVTRSDLIFSFPREPCVRVRVRMPEPHVSVQDPQSDQPAHPNVVAAAVVGGGPAVVSATVADSVVASAVVASVAASAVKIKI